MEALGQCHAAAQGAVPDLIKALADSSCRNAAITALGQIGPEARAAMPELTRALSEVTSRRVAAEALGNLGAEARSAVPALVEALGDKNSGVRSARPWPWATSGRTPGRRSPPLRNS